MNTPIAEEQNEIIYFRFEEDFVEENVRCIPMIVRFKLDACGIKLKLAEWSRFDTCERRQLSELPCSTREEIKQYKNFLRQLILKRTGLEATYLEIEESPAWADTERIFPVLQQQANRFGWEISIEQWKNLFSLQRFALLKLCRPGHENKNFPKAMKEFGLVS